MKQRVSEALNVPATQQRLIYKGRVLKDDLTLENYEIQDGHTVHMVKSAGAAGAAASSSASTSAQPTPAPAPSSLPTPPAANPFNMMGAGAGMNPFAAMGGMQPRGPPDVNRMQEQLMRNPEVMQQIMNSPMMDSMLNNPELMRNMMLNNPQMQAMLDANPQIRHILNDPAVSCSPICYYVYATYLLSLFTPMLLIDAATVHGNDA
ncbi:hypothetical protein EON64_19745 [archaeon]|nr:MAG: hypothetical protein EON64_19745 [archaeon]